MIVETNSLGLAESSPPVRKIEPDPVLVKDLRQNDLIALLHSANANNVNYDLGSVSPLSIAIKKNAPDSVKHFLDLGADYLQENEFGQSPLYLATSFAGEKVWDILASSKGFDPNIEIKYPRKTHRTRLLNLAAEHGNLGAVKSLLRHGADPRLKSSMGFSALQAASYGASVDIAKVLIDSLIDKGDLQKELSAMVKIQDIDYPTVFMPLFSKQESGEFYPRNRGFSKLDSLATMQLLIDSGANLVATNGEGKSLTQVAFDLNKPNHLELLETEKPKKEEIIRAVKNGSVRNLRLLYSMGANLDFRLKDSSSLLHLASSKKRASNSNDNVLSFLLYEARLDPNSRLDAKHLKRTPLHTAILAHNRNAIRELIRFNLGDGNAVDVNAVDRFGYTPLHYAVLEKDTMTVLDLLKAGADPSIEASPKTAFQVGAILGESRSYPGEKSSILKQLGKAKQANRDSAMLAYDMPVSISSQLKTVTKSDSNYALFSAIAERKAEAIPNLLRQGMNPNIRFESSSYYPIHYAARKKDPVAIKALLDDERTDPNLITSTFNFTPLHIAVLRNDLPTVKALLASPKVNPNIPDKVGATPLHYAVKNANTEFIDLLTKRKASTTLKTKKHSPLTFAHFLGKRKFIKRILAASQFGEFALSA